MQTKYFVGATAGLTAMVLGAVVAVAAIPTSAASGDYAFLNRGVVESVSTTNNTIQLTATRTSTKATADTQSKKVTYSLKNAKVYKWENGVKVQRNINHIRVGDEMVLDGNKTSGSYIVDVATINDLSFEVVGRVKDYDTDENWIKVRVGRSTLQHAGVVNTDIKFYYLDSGASETKCKRLGSTIDCSQIVNNDQGIKIRGVRSPGGQWDATHMWNRYPI